MDCRGFGEDRLVSVIEMISKLRTKEQKQQEFPTDETKVGSKVSANIVVEDSECSDSDTFSKKGKGKSRKKKGFEMPNLTMYNPPRRDEKCRICNTLETQGDTAQLYERHVNSYPTGCPRYISMSVYQRSKIAAAARFCSRCHDPAYIYQKNDTSHKCVITIRKKRVAILVLMEFA